MLKNTVCLFVYSFAYLCECYLQEEEGKLSRNFTCTTCYLIFSIKAALQVQMEKRNPISGNEEHECSGSPHVTDEETNATRHQDLHDKCYLPVMCVG